MTLKKGTERVATSECIFFVLWKASHALEAPILYIEHLSFGLFISMNQQMELNAILHFPLKFPSKKVPFLMISKL